MGVDGEALQLHAVYIQTVQVMQESVSGNASHVHCIWTCYYIEGSYDKIIITLVLSLQHDIVPWKLDDQRKGLYTSPWIHGENVQDHNMLGLEECPSNKTNKTPQLGRHLSCRKWTVHLQYWYRDSIVTLGHFSIMHMIWTIHDVVIKCIKAPVPSNPWS